MVGGRWLEQNLTGHGQSPYRPHSGTLVTALGLPTVYTLPESLKYTGATGLQGSLCQT